MLKYILCLLFLQWVLYAHNTHNLHSACKLHWTDGPYASPKVKPAAYSLERIWHTTAQCWLMLFLERRNHRGKNTYKKIHNQNKEAASSGLQSLAAKVVFSSPFSFFDTSTWCHLLPSFHLLSIKLADHTHLHLAAQSWWQKKTHIRALKWGLLERHALHCFKIHTSIHESIRQMDMSYSDDLIYNQSFSSVLQLTCSLQLEKSGNIAWVLEDAWLVLLRAGR